MSKAKSGGRVFLRLAILFRIDSAASSVFAPRVLRISIEMPRVPFVVDSVVSSRSVSRTLATMPNVTGALFPALPSRATMTRSKSVASLNFPCTRTRRSERSPTRKPAA